MTRLHQRPWAVLAVLCLGFFMILLDTTIVNIAIPAMQSGLHASLDEVLWVVNVYLLTYAVPLIVAGRLGDWLGPKRLYVAGLIVFTLASALCGLSTSAGELIAARAVQGVGAALLTPQTLAFITMLFPPTKRGAAFGFWGSVAGFATVAGPLLGGVLVESFGWRWIFFVNLPVGVISLVLAAVLVPDPRPGTSHHFDLPGMALVCAGMLAVTFGLLEGERYHWGKVVGPVTIPMLIVTGVLLLIGFVLLQRVETREPLVPLRLFANRNFSLGNVVAMAVGFSMITTFLPLTLYLQSVLGLSPLMAGLATSPASLTSGVLAPVAGRLSDRVGGKYLLMGGLSAFAAGIALVLAHAEVRTNPWHLAPALVLMGIGMGCVFSPMASVAVGTLDPRRAGAGSGVFNTTRQAGGVIGVAAMGALLQARLAAAIRDEAVRRAGQLPEPLRQQFLDSMSRASVVGGSHAVGTGLAPNLPPEAAAALTRLGTDVYHQAFVEAIRGAALMPIIVLLVAAVCCLGMVRPGRPGVRAGRAQAATEAA